MQRIIDQINSLINEKPSDLDHWLKTHIKELFDSPYIYKYYQVLKNHQSDDPTVKIILAWMALLSGDNLSLSRYAMMLKADDFEGNIQSFFYDLHALSGVFGSPKDRLIYSQKSLDNLSEPVDFFYANAYLTNGQIHNGLNAYRQAYKSFFKAYEIFFLEKMMFPSAVSLTNALLAKYQLADLDTVIREGKKTLLMASSMDERNYMYWDVVRLPLGMAYYEQGFYHEASYHLEKALKAINHLSLIHMHGLIELSLLKVYTLDNNQSQFKRILEDTRKVFKQMNYPIMNAILIYADFLKDGILSEMDLEQLQLIYKEDKHPQMFIVELLLHLSNKEGQTYIELDDYINHMDHCRYHGNVISLVSMSLLLADYYLLNQEKDKAKILIDEAIADIKKHQLKSVLNLYPYECMTYIEKNYPFMIDKRKTTRVVLTDKEMEVLHLLKEGCTNKDIAQRLFISVGTVKWHMNHILSKLDVKNRTQAVQEAIKLGLYKNLT
jgi:LuxR family maltose regulon positive regulatory protein